MAIIRELREDDFTDWHRLWTAYLAFYKTTLPEEVKTGAFARLLDAQTPVHGLLAQVDDRPVGLVHYIFHDHLWRPEGVCYLQDLYANPAVCGCGTGGQLIEAVYAAADAAQRPRVYWLTQDFNHEARQLYDRIATLSPFIKYDRT